MLFRRQLTESKEIKAALKQAAIVTISIGGNNLLYCARNQYTTINEVCAFLGVASFKSDWPKILKEVRKRMKSSAKLFVTTLYNPYKGDDPNYKTADSYIKQINTTISNPTYIKKYNYQVVDVYTHFKGKMNTTWKTCTFTHFCQPVRDPHPTDKGHYEIYQLHRQAYT